MLTLAATCLLAPNLIVRTASASLLPDPLWPLGGYTARRSALPEPGGADLFTRVAVFESGETRVAVASLELLTIPESLYWEVRVRVPLDVSIFLAATHTHSAPDSQALNSRMTFQVPGIERFDRAKLEAMAKRVSSAINSALASPPLPRAKFTLREAEAKGLNRGRREGALPDPRLGVLDYGQPVLMNFAAHGTALDEKWNRTHGDWPGLAAARFRAAVLPGAIGDVSPVLGEGAGPVEKADKYVENLYFAATKGTAKESTWTGELGGVATAPITLPPPTPHAEFATANKVPIELAKVLVQRFAPAQAEVSAVSLGRLVIVGVPGEPTSELGRKIEALARAKGFPHCWTVSHVNGWIGYILEPADYDRGGYEATLSFFGRDVSERVLESVDQALARLVARSTSGQSR